MSETLVVALDNPDPVVVRKASEIVRNGGLIVYPTETLYGIGADAMKSLAISKIKEAKRRKDNKPILVIVNSPAMMIPLVNGINAEARLLMERFWPGPLTLVFKASPTVPLELTSSSNSIGIRIPASTFCLQLLSELAGPLTSTSANVAGEMPSRTLDASRNLHGIDLFIDAGELPESLPSTVVDVSSTPPKLLRRGAVPIEQIQHVVSDILFPTIGM